LLPSKSIDAGLYVMPLPALRLAPGAEAIEAAKPAISWPCLNNYLLFSRAIIGPYRLGFLPASSGSCQKTLQQ